MSLPHTVEMLFSLLIYAAAGIALAKRRGGRQVRPTNDLVRGQGVSELVLAVKREYDRADAEGDRGHTRDVVGVPENSLHALQPSWPST
jgi:hypothetical protein